MSKLVDHLLARPWLALAAALVVEILIYTFGQADFVASDPLWYSAIAHDLAVHPSDVFSPAELHPFVMRIGLTVPLSLLYRVFGVSTFVTNLPSLVAALGITAIVYAAAPTARAKLVGMVVCVTCIPLVRNANILNIDLPAAALMATAVLCMSREGEKRRTWLAAGVVATVAAFLVKETAVWCAPVWLFVIVRDLRRHGARETARLYLPALVVGAVLVAGYLALCAHIWGTPFARFRGVDQLTYEHTWSLHGKAATAWVNRLTWQPAWLLATMFYGTLALALLGIAIVRGALVWKVATAAFFAFYWFGSVSLSSYSPMPISHRMVLPVLPGLLVLATLGADAALDRITRFSWARIARIVVVLALVVPAGSVALSIVRRGHPETDAFERLRDEAAHTPGRIVVVCGEPRCVAIGGFYFGLAVPANVVLVTARDFAAGAPPEGASVRAFVNTGRAVGARSTGEDASGPIEALKLPALYRHRHIRLYDAGDGRALWDALRAPR